MPDQINPREVERAISRELVQFLILGYHDVNHGPVLGGLCRLESVGSWRLIAGMMMPAAHRPWRDHPIPTAPGRIPFRLGVFRVHDTKWCLVPEFSADKAYRHGIEVKPANLELVEHTLDSWVDEFVLAGVIQP